MDLGATRHFFPSLAAVAKLWRFKVSAPLLLDSETRASLISLASSTEIFLGNAFPQSHIQTLISKKLLPVPLFCLELVAAPSGTSYCKACGIVCCLFPIM